jgi:hypothetical protein
MDLGTPPEPGGEILVPDEKYVIEEKKYPLAILCEVFILSVS